MIENEKLTPIIWLIIIILVASLGFYFFRDSKTSTYDEPSPKKMTPYTQDFPRELMLVEADTSHEIENSKEDGKNITQVNFVTAMDSNLLRIGYETSLQNNRWTITSKSQNQITATKESFKITIDINEVDAGNEVKLTLIQ